MYCNDEFLLPLVSVYANANGMICYSSSKTTIIIIIITITTIEGERERKKRVCVYKTAKQSIYGLSSFMFDRINLLLAQFVNVIYVLSVFMFTQNAHITSHSSRTATAF